MEALVKKYELENRNRSQERWKINKPNKQKTQRQKQNQDKGRKDSFPASAIKQTYTFLFLNFHLKYFELFQKRVKSYTMQYLGEQRIGLKKNIIYIKVYY